MPLRFRQTITLVPGLLRLNLNRRSTSISIGPRGLSRTWSTTGRRTTSVDLPGPFSWRTTSSRRNR